MPKFYVTSKNSSGKTQTTVFDAEDQDTAVAITQSQGLFVVSVQPLDEAVTAHTQTGAPAASARKFTHDNIILSDIVVFARQLATMLEAGVPLLRSLTIITEQLESRRMAQTVEDVKSTVEQGQSLSKALEKHPQVFGQFWVSLVEVGEASGTMPRVLNKLTEYMESVAKFRAQLVGAMIYPIILLTIGFGAVLVFALFIGPIFEKVFAELHANLPGLTLMMLGLFKFLQTKFIFVAAGAVGIFFAFKAYLKTSAGRWQMEMFLFNLPMVGNIFRLVVVEKFTSQMAILIESGVPILFALEISQRLVDNMVCGAVLKDVYDEVREGKLLADALGKSGFFPSMAVQMIRVGEETGELSKMLGHVAVYYKGLVEDFMKNISTLIEPFMLVFMGVIIGTLVVSMFLPLLTLSTGG
ncbi:MAG: type II secretion system F family protein [Candidatus Omnitrophica bacterium]|nr:type II secretion system F family protein [Candidatus Omnitrophota bacterium]